MQPISRDLLSVKELVFYSTPSYFNYISWKKNYQLELNYTT